MSGQDRTETIERRLLADYVRTGSEGAFRQLVERYGQLVYSAAYRRLQDHHLAEDAAQATFIVFAEKARSLGKNTMLGGWLWRTAVHVAGHMIRSRGARARREQAVWEPEAESRDTLWQQVAPELDGALATLSAKTREAVVAYYLLGKSQREIAEAYGVKLSTARMRILTGIKRLRAALARRGFAVPLALLAAFLNSRTAEAVSAGLCDSIHTTAFGTAGGAAAAGGSAYAIARGAMRAMAWVKLKVAALFVTTAVGVGTLGGALLLQNGPHPAAGPASVMNAEEAPWGRDVRWRPIELGSGGHVESIACDPRHPDIVYAGTAAGGLFVSTDGGRSYKARNEGLRDYFIHRIAVHPLDTRIVLLGAKSGIYKSTDRAHTWRRIENGFLKPDRWSLSMPIGALCFDPSNPDVVYAGVGQMQWVSRLSPGGRIYKSTDCGESWSRVGEGQLPANASVNGLAVKPGDGRVVLAATGGGLYRSADSGRTWALSGAGLLSTDIREVAFAPSAPNVAYGSAGNTAEGNAAFNGGVYRSDDGGLSWQRRSAGLPGRAPADAAGRTGADIRPLVVDPENGDVVYVGNHNWDAPVVFKTVDGGRRWRGTMDRRNVAFGWVGTLSPVKALAIARSDPSRLYAGTFYQAFGTRDAARSWVQLYGRPVSGETQAGRGLDTTAVNAIVCDPVRPGRLFLCCDRGGLWLSDDKGQSWRRANPRLGVVVNAFAVVVDPQEPATLWAATDKQDEAVSQSTDGGREWRPVGRPATGLPAGAVRVLLLDPSSPVSARRLYAVCEGHGVYAGDRGGTRWTCVNGDLPARAARHGFAMAMNPDNPRHLRLVCRRGETYETHDGGTHWTGLSRPGDAGDVTALAADPADFETLYMATRWHKDAADESGHSCEGALYKTVNGGRTWRRILNYREVNCVAVSPVDRNVLYAGTDDGEFHDESTAEGVLKSLDGGRTWQHENTGLTFRRIGSLTIDPHEPGRLYVGTRGSGAFVGGDEMPRTRWRFIARAP
ncbi:MAG: sigma-70 family RNA polymerase sigma factor [Kiritimatiellae bacterium]|nr:sigma-70 family RNA polymerase sigma factor [Kiritimatiellia bacterium]